MGERAGLGQRTRMGPCLGLGECHSIVTSHDFLFDSRMEAQETVKEANVVRVIVWGE